MSEYLGEGRLKKYFLNKSKMKILMIKMKFDCFFAYKNYFLRERNCSEGVVPKSPNHYPLLVYAPEPNIFTLLQIFLKRSSVSRDITFQWEYENNSRSVYFIYYTFVLVTHITHTSAKSHLNEKISLLQVGKKFY